MKVGCMNIYWDMFRVVLVFVDNKCLRTCRSLSSQIKIFIDNDILLRRFKIPIFIEEASSLSLYKLEYFYLNIYLAAYDELKKFATDMKDLEIFPTRKPEYDQSVPLNLWMPVIEDNKIPLGAHITINNAPKSWSHAILLDNNTPYSEKWLVICFDERKGKVLFLGDWRQGKESKYWNATKLSNVRMATTMIEQQFTYCTPETLAHYCSTGEFKQTIAEEIYISRYLLQ